jgi:DNA anti-recombination protein RmuC
MDIAAVLLALVTLAAGLATGWALAANRTAGSSANSSNRAAAATAERDAAVADRDQLRASRDELAATLRTAELRVQETSTKLEALEQSEEQLKDTFARMSSEALQRSSTQFLEMADSRFKLAGAPLTETLTKVEAQLRDIEKSRTSATDTLKQQIDIVRDESRALRTETASLVSALRKPQARGRWGELQLRRCVEYAGMTDRCDFTEQTSVSTADGVLRPDLVVRLVGGKSVVVDSKVTLSAYLEAHDATDDNVREERLTAHARHLRQHVDQLAAKAYWAQFSPTPEFVLLFVPGEAFLAPALDRDPALLEDALAKGVHIVTPTSLVSALRTVAYTWQQDALAANAAQVFDLGRELYTRLGTMGGHVDKLGRQLTGAVNSYNDTVRSLESRVLVTARKLNDLEVIDSPLETRTLIDESVRPVGAPELVESAEQSRAVIVLPSISADSADTADARDLDLFDRAGDYGLDDSERDADQGPAALKA